MQLEDTLPEQDKEACTRKRKYVETLKDFIEPNKKKTVHLISKKKYIWKSELLLLLL